MGKGVPLHRLFEDRRILGSLLNPFLNSLDFLRTEPFGTYLVFGWRHHQIILSRHSQQQFTLCGIANKHRFTTIAPFHQGRERFEIQTPFRLFNIVACNTMA